MTVNHQFLNREYFFPTWGVNKLFLGTFNPICGQQLDYYYRRGSNGFWRILKRYDVDDEYDFDDFTQLEEFMTDNHFGCVDVIRSVEFPDDRVNEICGNGYEDSKLFRVTGFTRTYNFEQIREYITENNVTEVFSTWGVRERPNDFRDELINFRQFCNQRNMEFTQLPSPSGRVYRGNNREVINGEWWNVLDPLFIP